MIICCENPCAFFYKNDSNKLHSGFSYWNVSFSDIGVGESLFRVFFNDDDCLITECFTNNIKMAKEIQKNINRHFDIFKNSQKISSSYKDASFLLRIKDSSQYSLIVDSHNCNIKLVWYDLQELKQTSVLIDKFGENGRTSYSVQASIIEAKKAILAVNGEEEQVHIVDNYGNFTSSAFLSLAESWISL